MTIRTAAFAAAAALWACSAAAESWRPGEPKLWRRDGEPASLAPRADGFTVTYGGEKDWCVNVFPRIPVKPGDVFSFSCSSAPAPGGPADGILELSATTLDADGQVIDWLYAAVRAKPGEKPRCRFVVPPGVAQIQPRFTGYRPVSATVTDIALAREKNLMEGRPPPAKLALSCASSAVEVDPASGVIALTDRRTGRVYRGNPGRGGAMVLGASSGRDWIEARLVDLQSLTPFAARYALDARTGELTVTLTGAGDLPRALDYPAPFETAKGDRLIVPENEGMGFPVDEAHEGLWRLVAYGGHGICMAFFGVCADADGSGWMCILETPDDVSMAVSRAPGGTYQAGPSWEAQKGRFGYARRARYVPIAKGGHVAMAKRYRAYAKGLGRLVTFREKARKRPAVDKLLGAANIWCWWSKGADLSGIVRDMRAHGIERILWSADGPPEFLAEMKKDPLALAGRYDIYQDIMDPANRDRLPWWHPDWVTEAFPHDINWAGPTREQWRHGWPVDAKEGPRVDCAVICDRQALPYARRRIGGELRTRPYQSRFIDTTTAAPWYECWNPAHPMTRTDSREWKMKLLDLVSGEFGLVCGCETGHDASVPYCDYFEGMLSIGPYRIDEAGRDMQKIVDEVPARTAKYQVGEKYRLPLWELVYHDCTVAQWYWGDYNNKLPKIWHKRDLFNALYGTPPMYMFNTWSWEKLKDRLGESYRLAAPVARLSAYAEMTDHQILTPDRAVQRTRFSNGVTVTVNFGDKPYTLEDGTALAPESARW